MFHFLLLCLAASISAAIPLNPLQAVLQSTIKIAPFAPSPSNAYDTLFQQIRESESPRTFVGVEFESFSSLDMPLQYFEFPLGERISVLDFPMLPLHPAHARIFNATMRTRSGKKLLSVDRLLDVICLAYPKVGGRGDNEQATGQLQHTTTDGWPIWWLAKDSEVDFEDPMGRAYLAGREVGSYECI